jgi:hypothetical protein
VHPKLGWVEELRSSLALAMGSSITVTIEEPADPLKKLVILTFGDRLLKGDYKPLQMMAQYFAKANNCVLERIRRRPGALVLEVLVKTRLGPVSAHNPLKE